MRKGIIAALLLLLCLVGRHGAELEGVELIRVLGVDGGEAVTLTAFAGGEEKNTYTVTGYDMNEAREALRTVGTKRLELTHISAILLGETAPVGETLLGEVVHRKSGCAAAVWLCEGDAQTVLEKGEEAADRLRSLEENAGAAAPGLLEALRTLRETGEVTLPVVREAGGELSLAGYRTIREEVAG